MKLRLLDLLRCPDCRTELSCEASEQRGAEIVAGALRCSNCGAEYPISAGVPDFVPGSVNKDQRKTAEAFGWEWQHFKELDAPYEEQFLDWLQPVGKEFFRDKTILDAGCGMGRWTAQSARFGAADVVGVDISEAAYVAQSRAEQLPNMHVVRADICRLPFDRPFSFAYSIGVLHHMPDPEAGFKAMVSHLAPGGSIHAWVYGYENNEWLVRIGNPVRERVSSRLPRSALFAISWAIAAALHPGLKLIHRFNGNGDAAGSPLAHLPYHEYLSWLARYSLQHNHHVVFDHLVAPTAFYIRKEEFQGWFERARLGNVQISWRNRNSWRGYGEAQP